MLKIRNCSVEMFLSQIGDKSIVVYGAGRVLRSACEMLGAPFLDRIACVIDQRTEMTFKYDFFEMPVKDIEYISALNASEHILLITPLVYDEIYNKLKSLNQFNGMDCYIFPIMRDTASPHAFPKPADDAQMKIPKRINYIWFGGGKMSDLNKRCIESWHRYCPDYEIILFNEDNYDITKLPFMYEAYKARKWASAADYARLDILKAYGGIYIDTDIELIQNIDFLLYNDFFGYLQGNWFAVNFFGCVANFPLISTLMKPYIENDYLQIKSASEYSEKIIVDNFKVNKMVEYGFKLWQDGERFKGGANIFPQDTIVLSTRTNNITSSTLGIHYYERTWCEELIPREERFSRFFTEHADALKVKG